MPVVKLKHVSYCYGRGTPFEKMALKDLSLSVEPGDFIGIIGHTGSGKSTLIRHMNGLLRPDQGEVLVDGENIWKHPANIQSIRFKVGLVFQYPESQIFEDTVLKDIIYGPKNMGLSDQEALDKARAAIDLVGLDESYLERNPFQLSGGELRRVAIAGVMAMEPSVLVLDEPTAGLDPEGRKRIFDQIENYRLRTGRAVIIVSHSMEDIAERVQKVAVIDNGKLIMSGKTADIFASAEQLESLGLDIPQITKVLIRLKKAGYPVNTRILTVDRAEEEILRLFGKVR
ncbi:energy-coupling factor transporter ATPase [Sporolactobacillus pectinivorans]|uniref:energy-coupling factor transporter ATPase n=1 Tax=Sporolactobacillus pectinivorans TaxID=1591408 RepID=UPI000C2585FA|nr:energy-coupling factor transporter ATPase [Sporolactobacillus pectinivorans]